MYLIILHQNTAGVVKNTSNNPHWEAKLSPPCYFCFKLSELRKGVKETEAFGTQSFALCYHASCQLLSPCKPIPGSQESLSEPTDAGSRGRLGKNSTVNTDTNTNVLLGIEAYSYMFPGKRLSSSILVLKLRRVIWKHLCMRERQGVLALTL